MNNKKISRIFAVIVVFVISFFILDQIFSLEIWQDTPQFISILIPLIGAWGISTAIGEKLISGKKAAIIATACLLVVAPLFHWQYIGKLTEGGKNQTGTDNQQKTENIPTTEKTLFKYEATFQYLSSEDNDPIEKALFLVFPCPTIDSKY